MRRISTFILIAAFAMAAASVAARASQTGSQTGQRTSRDGIYSKAQAARGAATYTKLCAACHDPDKPAPAGKDKGPVLAGNKFKDEWEKRALSELLSVTLLTMPNDGSAVLSESETADVIAHILQANGYPDGPTDLSYEAGKDIVIVK